MGLVGSAKCFRLSSIRYRFLKFEHVSASPGRFVKTLIAGPYPQRFWFTRSGVDPHNLHFCQVPKEYSLSMAV